MTIQSINDKLRRSGVVLTMLSTVLLGGCAAEDPASAETGELGSELRAGHKGKGKGGHRGKRHHKKRHRLLETLTVPTFSETEAVFVSSQNYPSNSQFLIKVSGLVVWGGCDIVTCPLIGPCNFQRLGDAQFNSDTCFLPPDPTFTNFPFADIQLFLDGAPIPPAALDEDHEYKFVVPGNDGPFVFNYNDCPGCYGDNSGEFTVRIFKL